MDCIDQFLTRKRMRPGLVLITASTHFGDDHKTVRIRMQCPLNDLIGHMWTIVVAGINVVHPPPRLPLAEPRWQRRHREAVPRLADQRVALHRSPSWTSSLSDPKV